MEMSDKKETLREELEKYRREIDELARKEKREDGERGISEFSEPKMQRSDPWPDPPEDEKESSDER